MRPSILPAFQFFPIWFGVVGLGRQHDEGSHHDGGIDGLHGLDVLHHGCPVGRGPTREFCDCGPILLNLAPVQRAGRARASALAVLAPRYPRLTPRCGSGRRSRCPAARCPPSTGECRWDLGARSADGCNRRRLRSQCSPQASPDSPPSSSRCLSSLCRWLACWTTFPLA